MVSGLLYAHRLANGRADVDSNKHFTGIRRIFNVKLGKDFKLFV
jgi:hypothetical protein